MTNVSECFDCTQKRLRPGGRRRFCVQSKHYWHQGDDLFLIPIIYAPRRHSRRLLLPPGWVALGFLLPLGCRVLLTDKRLQPESVLQLTMPISEKKAKERYGDIPPYCFCKPLADIRITTRWQSAQLIGNSLSYPVNEVALEAAVRAMQADEGHARGVRIYFRPTATYGNLVRLLDMMNRLDQPRYWLDIEHSPVTFYAVNAKALKIRIPTIP